MIIKQKRGRPKLDEMTIREKLPVRIPLFKHIKLKMDAAALGKTLTQHVEDKLDK